MKEIDWEKYIDFYLSQEISLIPIDPKTKQPPEGFPWKQFQKRRAKKDEVLGWIAKGWGLAAVGGSISKNLITIDVDEKKPKGRGNFNKLFGIEIAKETFAYKTGSHKGWAILYRTDTPVSTSRGKHNIPIDMRGEGGYEVLPPSLHPSGNRYELIENLMTPVKHWSGDFEWEFYSKVQKAKIKGFKWKQKKFNAKTVLLNGVHEGERDDSAIRLATWFRKEGKTQEETLTIMLKWNAEKVKPPLSDNVIELKVNSAWRPSEPYDYVFADVEIYDAETIKQANELLDNPERILPYIRKANAEVVGEDKNKILIPVLEIGKQSIEVSGRTAGGKNTLVDSCLACVPNEWYKKVTGLSDKSLRHLPKNLRTLYIAERRGMKTGEESTAEYDIKVGISEGKITSLITQRSKKRGWETVKKEVIIENFIMTTTEVAPPPELANRIYNLIIDESVPQNLRVVKRTLGEYSIYKKDRINTESQKKVLRCLFEIVDNEAPIDFVIPWATALLPLLPPSETTIRRHVKKLINLIGSIARLFYRIVEIKDNQLIVPPPIFWYVWKIGDDAIFAQIIGLTEVQMKAWNEMEKLFLAHNQVSLKQATEAIGKDKSTITRLWNLFELKNLIITQIEGRERIATQITQEAPKAVKPVTLNDLEQCYENGSISFPSFGGKFKVLVDPLTDKTTLYYEAKKSRIFSLPLQTIKVVQKKKSLSHHNLQNKRNYRSFEDVLKR